MQPQTQSKTELLQKNKEVNAKKNNSTQGSAAKLKSASHLQRGLLQDR
jgi:hypothetical protein